MAPQFKNKDKLIKLFRALYPDCKIYLFGSRARGDQKSNSDIDLAIETGLGIRLHYLDKALLYNIIEALNIPYQVDLVDLDSNIPAGLRDHILNEGILLCLD